MRDYELQVLLTNSNGGEWVADTLVNAPNMAKARTMAKQFAMLEAETEQAVVSDYWAIDLETGEQSD